MEYIKYIHADNQADGNYFIVGKTYPVIDYLQDDEVLVLDENNTYHYLSKDYLSEYFSFDINKNATPTNTKIIQVNNKQTIELEFNERGILVTHKDSDGKIERRDLITESEIVMLLNLFINIDKSVYIIGDFAMNILKETCGIDDVTEYRIKQ